MTLSCWREYGVVDLCIRNKGFLYSSYKCFRLANDPAQVTMFVEVFCVTAALWEERRESRWDSSDTSSLHSQTSRHSPGENWNFAFNQWNFRNMLLRDQKYFSCSYLCTIWLTCKKTVLFWNPSGAQVYSPESVTCNLIDVRSNFSSKYLNSTWSWWVCWMMIFLSYHSAGIFHLCEERSPGERPGCARWMLVAETRVLWPRTPGSLCLPPSSWPGQDSVSQSWSLSPLQCCLFWEPELGPCHHHDHQQHQHWLWLIVSAVLWSLSLENKTKLSVLANHWDMVNKCVVINDNDLCLSVQLTNVDSSIREPDPGDLEIVVGTVLVVEQSQSLRWWEEMWTWAEDSEQWRRPETQDCRFRIPTFSFVLNWYLGSNCIQLELLVLFTPKTISRSEQNGDIYLFALLCLLIIERSYFHNPFLIQDTEAEPRLMTLQGSTSVESSLAVSFVSDELENDGGEVGRLGRR